MDRNDMELKLREHCCEYISCDNCVLYNTPYSCKFDTTDDKEIDEMYNIIKNIPNTLEEINNIIEKIDLTVIKGGTSYGGVLCFEGMSNEDLLWKLTNKVNEIIDCINKEEK